MEPSGAPDQSAMPFSADLAPEDYMHTSTEDDVGDESPDGGIGAGDVMPMGADDSTTHVDTDSDEAAEEILEMPGDPANDTAMAEMTQADAPETMPVPDAEMPAPEDTEACGSVHLQGAAIGCAAPSCASGTAAECALA